MAWDDVVGELGLTPLVNVSGTETVFGASPVSPEVVRAIAGILPHSVDMAELQRAASAEIAAATGAEAGFVTGCSAAAIVIAVASAMTGLDLAAIERLPDTTGLKDEVVIQKGHIVNYGSAISGDIRLTGAKVVEIGAAMESGLYQLRAALGPRTAAAVYVVSHHAAPTGMIALPAFAAACHAAGVPVIVDAAAEYGWREVLAAGADLVLFSAQKAIGGPTAGIVAGRRDLVRACYAQSRGIGRPMKAGKEAVVGTIAALRRWRAVDPAARRRAVEANADALMAQLGDLPGVAAARVEDETGNPFCRVVLTIDPQAAGYSAYALARALQAERPKVLVRSLQADRGILQIDVRRLDPPTLALVAGRIRAAAAAARALGPVEPPPLADQSAEAVLRWPG
ncbi:MAG: aminotransferase class V-fold PLP-dependent enzyme [Dongiaceae bacterium]